MQQVSRSHAWRLYFFSKMMDGFQIVVNPPTPFQIYIFIIFRGVRNRDQPSDPFSDLYSFIFWVLKSLQPLMAGGRALFCPKSKMTFGTDFSGTPCIFLLVLTIIPIVALLKTKKHDSSTNIRCTGPPGPPVCGGNPGNRQQGVRDSIRHI